MYTDSFAFDFSHIYLKTKELPYSQDIQIYNSFQWRHHGALISSGQVYCRLVKQKYQNIIH